MKVPRKTALDDATKRQLALKYSVHPRSLEKVLRGGVVRGLPGHRIREGLLADGLLDLAPQMQTARLGSFADRPGEVVADDETESEPT